MTRKIITDTAVQAAEATGEWARLSARLTTAADSDLLATTRGAGAWVAGAWAGRDDVIVTITPGAGGGAPACFNPALARIEIDGKLLEVRPENFDPADADSRDECAATWGLLTHEAAHVRFSDWLDDAEATLRAEVKAGTTTQEQADEIIGAAMLLEEARIETQQCRVRPDDKRWLRASAAKHLLEDIDNGSVGSAINTLALVGGRQMSGIILPAEGNAVLLQARKIVNSAPSRDGDKTIYGMDHAWTGTDSYGASRPARLMEVLERAIHVPAANGDLMLSLAREWVAYLPQQDKSAKLSAAARRLQDGVKEMAQDIAALGGHVPSEEDPDNNPLRYKPEKWTPATPASKQAAAALADALKQYVIPERSSRPVRELMPPGKLGTREAMRADAQDARGLIPDATPWKRTAHRVIPTPPLRVGMAVDVSGSMTALEKHTWEIVFRFATAFGQLPDCEIQVQLAGVGTCQAKLRPGLIPSYSYNHGCERVDLAVGKLRERLSLTRRGWARLLIIVSDAGFRPVEHTGTVRECKDLMQSGCGVLWLDLANGRGYRAAGNAIAEVEAAGGHCVNIEGTPAEAAKLAERELIKVVQDANSDIRKGLTR